MNVLDRIEIDEAKLADICRRYRVRELALFGSVLRDDFRDDSDVDVLVEFEPDAPIGLAEHFGLQNELAALLGRDADLVSKTGMRPRFAKRVLPEMRVIYGSPSGCCGGCESFMQRDRQRAEDCLHDIVEFAGDVNEMVGGLDRETFMASDLIRSAVALKLVWIGESVIRIPDEHRGRYPHVSWDRHIAFRDLATHRYFDLDGTSDWDAATTDAPELRDNALRILAAEFPEEPERGI